MAEQLPIPEPQPAPETQHAAPPEFRYPDDATVPVELRGKTSREAAELFAAYTASGMAAAPTPPPTPPASNGGYATTGQLQQVAQQQAGVTLSLARQQHPEIFAKWGHEVNEILTRVPPESWTLDVIDKAVRMVKGTHLEEIVQERVRAATVHPLVGMRSNGNGTSGATGYAPQRPEPPIEGVPGEWLKHAEQAGITDREVAEFERANDLEPGEFLKQFGGRYITDAIADVNPGRRKA